MESALMIVPPSASASAKASADLPLAVGPAIRMACRASARLIRIFAVALRKNISPRNRRCVLSFTPLQGQIRELVKDDSWLVSHGWSADSWHGRHDPDRLSTRTWDSRITRIEPAFATD